MSGSWGSTETLELREQLQVGCGAEDGEGRLLMRYTKASEILKAMRRDRLVILLRELFMSGGQSSE